MSNLPSNRTTVLMNKRGVSGRRFIGRAFFGASLLLIGSIPALGLPAEPPVQGTDDVRVNTPGPQGGDMAENCNTQNEVSIARHRNKVVAGWVDGGQCDFRTRASGAMISGYGYSSDGGVTWTDGGLIEPEPGGNVLGDPVLAANAKGRFYYATLADDASGRSIIGVARSTDGGKTWSAPVDASPGRPATAFQDKPWIAVDMRHRRNVYVVWREDQEDGRRRMLFSRSTNGGVRFRSPIELPTPTDPNVASCDPRNGAQVAVGPKGEVYVVWIGENFKLCFQRSLDGGVTFTTAREFVHPEAIGHHQENCVGGGGVPVARTVLDGDIRVEEWPSLAVDTSSSAYKGTVYVAVASDGPDTRSDDEADVFLLYSRDGGTTWQVLGTPAEELIPTDTLIPATRLNDDETSNDQFHPTVAVGPGGTVAVTWYDRRLSDDPLRENWEIDVFSAVSHDGGETFGTNFRVSDESFPPSQTNPNTNGLGGCYMGEYNGLVPSGRGQFLAAWGDNRDTDAAGLPDPNVYFDRIQL